MSGVGFPSLSVTLTQACAGQESWLCGLLCNENKAGSLDALDLASASL